MSEEISDKVTPKEAISLAHKVKEWEESYRFVPKNFGTYFLCREHYCTYWGSVNERIDVYIEEQGGTLRDIYYIWIKDSKLNFTLANYNTEKNKHIKEDLELLFDKVENSLDKKTKENIRKAIQHAKRLAKGPE